MRAGVARGLDRASKGMTAGHADSRCLRRSCRRLRWSGRAGGRARGRCGRGVEHPADRRPADARRPDLPPSRHRRCWLPRGLPPNPKHARGTGVAVMLALETRWSRRRASSVVDTSPGGLFRIQNVRGDWHDLRRGRQGDPGHGAGTTRPQALPGWTLLGVVAAGRAQAMAKSHGARPGWALCPGCWGSLLLTSCPAAPIGGRGRGRTERPPVACAGPGRAGPAGRVRPGARSPRGLQYAVYLAAHRSGVHSLTCMNCTSGLGAGDVRGAVSPGRGMWLLRRLPGNARSRPTAPAWLRAGLVGGPRPGRPGREMVPDS